MIENQLKASIYAKLIYVHTKYSFKLYRGTFDSSTIDTLQSIEVSQYLLEFVFIIFRFDSLLNTTHTLNQRSIREETAS